jgi:hypothetical protein
MTFDAGGDFAARTLSSTGGSVNADSTGGNVDVGTTTAAQNISFSAPAGTVSADSSTAGGSFNASSAQGMTLGDATSGRDMTFDAGGDFAARTLSSTGGSVNADSTGGNVDVGTTTAAQNISFSAPAGTVSADGSTAGGSFNASALGNVSVNIGSAGDGFALASFGGNVDAGTITANSVTLTAPGSVSADTLNVDSSVFLSGSSVSANVYGGASPVTGSVTGFGGAPATNVNLTLSAPGGFAFDTFSAASATVIIPDGAFSIDHALILDRATFTNPMTLVLVDQHDRSIQPADVQLYSAGSPFSMYLNDNSLTTDSFVIHRSPQHEVITPGGTNTSVLEQAQEDLSSISNLERSKKASGEDEALVDSLVSYEGTPVSLECDRDNDPECME